MAARRVQTAEKSRRIDAVTDTQIFQRLDLRARPCCFHDRDSQSAPNKVVISRPLHSASPGTRPSVQQDTRGPAGNAIAFSFCVLLEQRVARSLAAYRRNKTRRNGDKSQRLLYWHFHLQRGRGKKTTAIAGKTALRWILLERVEAGVVDVETHPGLLMSDRSTNM